MKKAINTTFLSNDERTFVYTILLNIYHLESNRSPFALQLAFRTDDISSNQTTCFPPTDVRFYAIERDKATNYYSVFRIRV
ncbi:hypothetical protein Trydic_g9353 [Trypoxylus dichotomus]